MGGYKIIDLQNKNLDNLTQQEITIDGIYNEIEGNYRKPILFENVVIRNVENTSFFSPITLSEGKYKFFQGAHEFEISDDDTVKMNY